MFPCAGVCLLGFLGQTHPVALKSEPSYRSKSLQPDTAAVGPHGLASMASMPSAASKFGQAILTSLATLAPSSTRHLSLDPDAHEPLVDVVHENLVGDVLTLLPLQA